ncbi:hypothetical protein PGIGA_G00095260 [Pangasianodon gigas]|uniref:Uncharacterized protein n=1 Tax=Pangasianodon gigas TaxID=30993 RepID=A0ACC5XDL8_PANGG|nr:hypothetical protein [Pangasianodon gigas]
MDCWTVELHLLLSHSFEEHGPDESMFGALRSLVDRSENYVPNHPGISPRRADIYSQIQHGLCYFVINQCSVHNVLVFFFSPTLEPVVKCT